MCVHLPFVWSEFWRGQSVEPPREWHGIHLWGQVDEERICLKQLWEQGASLGRGTLPKCSHSMELHKSGALFWVSPQRTGWPQKKHCGATVVAATLSDQRDSLVILMVTKSPEVIVVLRWPCPYGGDHVSEVARVSRQVAVALRWPQLKDLWPWP